MTYKSNHDEYSRELFMQPTSEQITAAVSAAAFDRLNHSLKKIQHCLDQLTEAQVWWRPQEAHNSIGNLILHLCGNVGQWILSGLGGEPDVRHRPAEFAERGPIPKAKLSRRLEAVVGQANAVLSRLATTDLLRKRRIQGFDVTALEAIFDCVPHFVGHTHQIVTLTRWQLGDAYRFEWAPTTPEQGAPP
jgi:hypothetical protein